MLHLTVHFWLDGFQSQMAAFASQSTGVKIRVQLVAQTPWIGLTMHRGVLLKQSVRSFWNCIWHDLVQ